MLQFFNVLISYMSNTYYFTNIVDNNTNVVITLYYCIDASGYIAYVLDSANTATNILVGSGDNWSLGFTISSFPNLKTSYPNAIQWKLKKLVNNNNAVTIYYKTLSSSLWVAVTKPYSEDILGSSKAIQPPLSFSSNTFNTVFNSTTNSFDLKTLALTGGSNLTSLVFSGLGVTGDLLTYGSTGSYIVTATKGNTYNNFTPYTSNVTASITITIIGMTQPSGFEFTMSTYTFVYNDVAKTIQLSSSGGLISETAVVGYTCDKLSATVVGSTFTYSTAGSYTLTATKRATNYADAIVSVEIVIRKASPPSGFRFALPSSSYVYNNSKTVSLLSSGGVTTPDAVVTYGSSLANSINGSTFTYTNIGSYTMSARQSSINYEDSVATPVVIEIVAASPPSGFQIFLPIRTYVYDNSNKSIRLSSSGGVTTENSVVTYYSNNNQLSGSWFTYTNIGQYTLSATQQSTNYNTSLSPNIFVVIEPATQPIGFQFTIQAPSSFVYNPDNKTILLTSSGGLSAEPFTVIYSCTSSLAYSIRDSEFTYSNAGSYRLRAIKNSPNYTPYTSAPEIEIIVNKATQPSGFGFNMSTYIYDYDEVNKNIQLSTSGGLSSEPFVVEYSCSSISGTVRGDVLTYTSKGSYLITATKKSPTNFHDVTVSVVIRVQDKNIISDAVNKVIVSNENIIMTMARTNMNNNQASSRGSMPLKDNVSDVSNTFSLYRHRHAKVPNEVSSSSNKQKKKWYGSSGTRDSSVIIERRNTQEVGLVSKNPNNLLMSFSGGR